MATTPIVNLNGTGAAELLAQNVAAMEAINAAIVAVNAAAPHGRDYQLQSAETFRAAQSEHRARINALNGLLDEVEAIAQSIHEQKMMCSLWIA